MSVNVYEIVTNRILQDLEKGIIPWRKPWSGLAVKYLGRRTHDETRIQHLAVSRATGRPYSLLNQWLLGKPGEWATFKQVRDAGGTVRKGEKSSICVFWKFLEVERKDADGKPVCDPVTGEILHEQVPYLQYYNVFHVATQCDGITPRKSGDVTTVRTVVDDPGTPVPADRTWADIESADAIVRDYIARSGVKLTEKAGEDRAYYAPYLDAVTVPARAQFDSAGEFYSTLFHELTHSTGHSSRLDRFSGAGSHAFGSDNYSKEELVAEIGASCLNAIAGVETPATFKNSVAYIQNWSERFKRDPKLIVSASAKAERAVGYILGEVDA